MFPSLFDLFPKDLSSSAEEADRRRTPLHPLLGRDTVAGPCWIHTSLPAWLSKLTDYSTSLPLVARRPEEHGTVKVPLRLQPLVINPLHRDEALVVRVLHHAHVRNEIAPFEERGEPLVAGEHEVDVLCFRVVAALVQERNER